MWQNQRLEEKRKRRGDGFEAILKESGEKKRKKEFYAIGFESWTGFIRSNPLHRVAGDENDREKTEREWKNQIKWTKMWRNASSEQKQKVQDPTSVRLFLSSTHFLLISLSRTISLILWSSFKSIEMFRSTRAYLQNTSHVTTPITIIRRRPNCR